MTKNNDLLNLLLNELNRSYNQADQDLDIMLVELIHGDDIQQYIANNIEMFDADNYDISVEVNDSCYKFFKDNNLDMEELEDEYEMTIDMMFDKLYDYKNYLDGKSTNYDWY